MAPMTGAALYMAVPIVVPATIILMQPMMMAAVNIRRAAVTAMATQQATTATVITM